MKILFLEFEPIGGPPHRLWELANYLTNSKRYKWDVKLVIDKRSVLANETNSSKISLALCRWNADFHTSNGITKYIVYIKTMMWLLYQSIMYNPDIVYCNHYQWVNYCTPLAILFNKPLFVHLRDYWELETRLSKRMLKIWPKTYYIAISKYVSKIFLKKNQLDKGKMTLIYDGILFNSKASSKSDKQNCNKIILSFSRLEPKRNLETFVDVAEILCAQHKNLIFKHYGFINTKENLKYLRYLNDSVRHSGYSKRIQFLPYIPTNKLEDIYKDAYLSVVTTPQFALPNSAIESLYYGVPVIACKGSGNSEVITHNKNGLLVDRATSFFFVRAINYYINNIGAYKKAVENAKQSVFSKFSAVKSYKKIEDFLIER